MYIPLYLILSLFSFYAFYLACMTLVRAYQEDKLTISMKILGYPILLCGVVIDFLMNITIFSVIFLQFPSQFLVTSRLKRNLKVGQGWRYKLAKFICEQLLNNVDPSHNHCD
jgi:hypothetical protein